MCDVLHALQCAGQAVLGAVHADSWLGMSCSMLTMQSCPRGLDLGALLLSQAAASSEISRQASMNLACRLLGSCASLTVLPTITSGTCCSAPVCCQASTQVLLPACQ